MHIEHLSRDKKMAEVIARVTLPEIQPRKHLHLELITSIMSQQLSTKVAQVLQYRFYQLFTKRNPGPRDILAIDFDALKGIGLSNAKATYIRNVCAFFIEQKLTDKKLYALNDNDIIDLLTQIKGVGKWTVQMILMFSLCREDVFSEDDFGIQKAMCAVYGLHMADKKQLKSAMQALSARWSPYRSYACRYLWRSLDGTP